MGSLNLPTGGAVYVDTSAVIYSLETHATYWAVLQPLWAAAKAGTVTILTSELTLMEVLVAPVRAADTVMQAAYEDLLASSDVRMLPVSLPILREAARLRAAIPALRTPDAIHAATATQAGAAVFITNDAGFRRVPGLPLALLDDVIAA